eukprot:gene9960-15780_t
MIEAATLGVLAFVMFISSIMASLYTSVYSSRLFGVASAGKAGYTTFVIFTWFSFIAILAAAVGSFTKSRQDAAGAGGRPPRTRRSVRTGAGRDTAGVEASAVAEMAAAANIGMEVQNDLAEIRRKSQQLRNSDAALSASPAPT